ncbi:hypothetical protein AAHA92_24864 [Salvia divinorum]|uniref:Myb/SANT-like domain-containing protein n=1 Tax=Salvia divinorum TaxID=28513 RepID=A0ABD1GBV2_SALDI
MSQSKRSRCSMEMFQGKRMTSRLGRGRQGKGERTRRSWSDREEETLLSSMKELVALGWKSDNGFRGGYLGKLEEALRAQYPASCIKATPHIVSKITAWKKSYYSLQGILQRSGVGFNLNDDYKIDCDDDQWAQIVKADTNARFMRDKSWPQYDDWLEIFGKDRANGSGAEDIMEALNGLYSAERQGTSDGGGLNAPTDDTSADDSMNVNSLHEAPADSTCQSAGGSESQSEAARKSTGDPAMDVMLELIGKMHEDTNARLQCLSLRIGYEQDLCKAQKEVFELLGRIPELSLQQKFDAGDILLEKIERLNFFLGIPEGGRLAYVLHALAKFNKP